MENLDISHIKHGFNQSKKYFTREYISREKGYSVI
ncbi:unnamed protein product [Amoebophrya sp. A25]|nr:unnamed protein product [Amoebophrya sp. A25]|eukprot:GSA25T00027463001.1